MTTQFTEYARTAKRAAAARFAASHDRSANPLLDHAAVAARPLLDDNAALYDRLALGFKRLAHADVAPVCDLPTRELIVHVHLAAFAARFETMPVSVWSQCEDALPDMIEPMREVEKFTDMAPPTEQVGRVLWRTLCVFEQAKLVGRDVDVEVTDAVVHFALSAWGDLRQDWVALHALACLALFRQNPAWARRVEQIAQYHMDVSPAAGAWGVFALLWPESTRDHGERLLGDLAGSERGDLVDAILLADAVNCLAQFVTTDSDV